MHHSSLTFSLQQIFRVTTEIIGEIEVLHCTIITSLARPTFRWAAKRRPRETTCTSSPKLKSVLQLGFMRSISALISHCQLPKDSGPCSGRGRTEGRYYYNRVSKECELFLWGGCGGNDNRFLFPHTCEEECTGN